MSGIFIVNNSPVELVSADTGGLDVDNVANRNFIVIGSSNKADHAIADSGEAQTSTRIMYGDAVAKLITHDGVEVELWGHNIDRYALMAGGLLIKLNWYEVLDWPNDSTKTMVKFSKSSDLYPAYGNAVIYKWSDATKAFMWLQDAHATNPNILLFEDGPLELLNGLFINIDSRTIDVDEDGPHMQKAELHSMIPNDGVTMFTQYSIYTETITTYFSAGMVESLECDAVPIQLSGGRVSPAKYKQLTTAQGLAFMNQMRTVRQRAYAPTDLCSGKTSTPPKPGTVIDDADIDSREVGNFKLDGKESNYSLTNLVRRYDFWPDFVAELGTVKQVFSCGGVGEILQSDSLIGTFSTPPGPDKWQGVLTFGAPRIRSYAPRYTHVEYKAAEHVLSWQEQRVNSYILFNNFEPNGYTNGPQPFGMGGPLVYVPA